MLETILTGRNLLSPVLANAGRDVVAFNSTVATAQGKAATSAQLSAGTQDGAAAKIAASNAKASTSAVTSANSQARAHAKAAESATLSARLQETANRGLAASNGMLGTSLTPLTAGLGAVGLGLAYAGYRGMEFGTAMSQVQAASQASAADMGRLKDAAIDAGAKTQYSAVEAAQGITEMSKAGVSARDILGGGLTGALNLAAAGQISVADAAETGATALSVFNLKGDQMSHVADLLAAGAGKAQGSVGDMSAALNQSALVANQAGLSIEDTAGALAMFASNGLVGSDAGTSFKTMLQALTPNSVAAAKAMDAIGFSAFDSQGKFIGLEAVAGQLKTGLAGLTEEQRNSTLETIFGSDAVRAAAVLYDEGSAGVAKWAGNVDDAGYAQKQAAQLTDNLRGDVERLGGAFDSAMTTIGSGAQGALREAVQALTAIVNVGGDVLGFWNSLPGPVQVAIVTLGAVAALKGPVASALETIALKAMYMGESMAGASIGMTGLRAAGGGLLAMFGGPWGLAITGVTVGLSLLVSWLGQADDATSASSKATERAASAQQSYKQALEATNGVMDESVRRAAAKALQDDGLLDLADDLMISTRTMTDSLLGNKDAYEQILPVLEAYYNSLLIQSGYDRTDATDKKAAAVLAQIDAYKQLVNTHPDVVAGEQQIAAATGETAAQTEAAVDAQNKLGESLADFVDPLGAYNTLLSEKKEADRTAAEATAAATKSSKDSWRDYVTEVGVTFEEYKTLLEEQVTAQAEWQTNMLMLAGRVSAGTLAELARMGPEGAPLVADLVKRSDAELAHMDDLFAARSQEATNAWGATLTAAAPVLAAIGKTAGAGVVAGLAGQLQAGTITVAQIAAQYGINLAGGINPLLGALGKPLVRPPNNGQRAPGFADGGYTGDGDKYDPAGVVHRGEFVITKERTAKLGVRTLENLEKILPGYAAGGFVSGADVPRPPSTAPYGSPISTAGDAAMDTAYQATTKWIQETGPFGSALAFAKSQVGKPYIWGGVGPAGYDCSGFMSAITNVMRGRSPYSRVGATASFPWAGFAPGDGVFTIGSTPDAGGGVGHMAGTLMGVNVESRGGQGVVVGPSARGANNGLFTTRAHLTFDDGGLADGVGYLPKATVAPERVLDPRQTAAFEDWMRSPAAMPGYGSGGGGAGFGQIAVTVQAAPVRVYLDGQEWRGMARIEGQAAAVTALTTITERGRYNG